MADPQSAGGTAESGSLTASSSAPSSLVTCTTTVTVSPCSDTTSSTASSPTGSDLVSIVGPSPSDSQTASASSSTSALTSSVTSTAATSSDSTSSVPSSTSQTTTSQPTESSSTSSTDDAVSSSSTSSAVLIAGPIPSTATSPASSPTPLVATPSDSTTANAADVQTVQQNSAPSATDGVVFQSASDGDSSFTTATMSPSFLGTVGGPVAGTTSTSGLFPLASNSLGGGNSSSANSGTMNTAGTHAQSAASKRAVIAGAAVGGTLGFLLLFVGFLFFLRRRNQAARANTSRPMQKYFSTQGSVLGYGPDPFDRSTGIESVRTAADAFRGPGMIQHMSPAPSVHSARSIIQKMSRPDSLGAGVGMGMGMGMGEATPRSWTTFQPQHSPLRESMSTAAAGGVSGQGPISPSLAVPLMTPTASDGFLSPPSGAPLSTSAPGLANFSSNRSSKASSSLYSAQGASVPQRNLGDSVDPFRDSVVAGGAAGPSYGFGYDSGRRKSIGDSVDPFRDTFAAPNPHSGMYSPPGRAM